DLARKMGVKTRPAVVYVQDEATLTGDTFDRDLKKEPLSRFLSRCVGRHRSEAQASLKELTSARSAAGDCGPSDGHFCLLLLGAAEAATAALRSLAPKLWKDKVKVFYVKDADFATAFDASPDSVVLYRPKRKRFKLFSGDTGNVDELASWVDAAVGEIEMAPVIRAPSGKENRVEPRAKVTAVKEVRREGLLERRGALTERNRGPATEKPEAKSPRVRTPQSRVAATGAGTTTPRSGRGRDAWQEVRAAEQEAEKLEAELGSLQAECELLTQEVATAEAQEAEAEQQLTSQSAAMLS
ncbi:unnamed protein product, partial [Effrenium voratum]